MDEQNKIYFWDLEGKKRKGRKKRSLKKKGWGGGTA